MAAPVKNSCKYRNVEIVTSALIRQYFSLHGAACRWMHIDIGRGPLKSETTKAAAALGNNNNIEWAEK